MILELEYFHVLSKIIWTEYLKIDPAIHRQKPFSVLNFYVASKKQDWKRGYEGSFPQIDSGISHLQDKGEHFIV